MNATKYILGLVLCVGLCSCNEWLDVKPRTEKEREEYYNKEEGFRSSLIGCYMKLKGRTLYGEQLTMNGIEFMAQHWQASSESERDLMNFKYTTQSSENRLKAWYQQLYAVIAQTNDLLDYLDKKGDAIESEERRKMIRGEALAIRAFCHFDILRLFGQLPKDNTITRNLPYQERAANEPVPFYDFILFSEKILRDFNEAAGLLKVSDPAVRYSFEALNDPKSAVEKGYVEDDFDALRKIRFNYWAVKGLQARVYLYLGDKTNAWACAKEVIDARIEGKPVAELTAIKDYESGYFVMPGEVLTGLNIYNIDDYVSKLFRTSQYGMLYKPGDYNVILEDIFGKESSDARLTKTWTNVQGVDGEHYTIRKYWQTTKDNNSTSLELDMNQQMVPLLRLAEVYLIAIEAAPNPGEANRLFRTFKTSRDLGYTDLNEAQLESEILKEYRRELYAEGQMFFTYKRLGKKNMLWRTLEVKEEDYVLPLPKTEVEY